MQRRVFVSGAALPYAAVVALVAAPGMAQAPPVVWEDVASTNGRYRLKMPKGYRYLTVPTHGGTLHSYVLMLPDKFVLEFMDIDLNPPQPNIPTSPAALPAFFDQIQTGMQRSWPGSTVLEQRPIAQGAVIGREFTLTADQGSRVVIVRFYPTPAAIYSQVAQGPAAERGNPVITQFMESLRFS